MDNSISVKVIKGRHYGKRLYKSGKIYRVDQAEGEYLLAYKNTDGTPRFKRMIPKVAEPVLEEKPAKRRPGRPAKKETKQSDTVEKVVDELPIDDSDDSDDSLDGYPDMVEEDSIEADGFVEEELEVVEETESFDPNDDEQEYIHEV